MATMSIRATYALDPTTAQYIRELALNWGVSQAEVIRRSVRQAAAQETPALSPADVLAHYASQPSPRTATETRALITALRNDRRAADRHRNRP
jgi:hypothetical protein